MKMTIGKRIVVGFVASLAFTVALGAIAYSKMMEIQRETSTLASQTLRGIDLIANIRTAALENLLRVESHILARTDEERAVVDKEIAAAREKITAFFKDYEQLVTSDENRRLHAETSAARAAFLPIMKRALELSHDEKDEQATVVLKSELYPAFHKYAAATDALNDYNLKQGEGKSERVATGVASAKMWIVSSLSASFVVISLLAFFMIRSINTALGRMATTLGEGSNQVAAASGQVSSSSQSLAQGASEQAASLEETTSAIEEMSSMTKKNAETAQQAATLAAETKSTADKGNQAMQKMGVAIAEIQKSAAETAKIIKVIDEIAFQTNLLALNAAVEAARAGESGKGFAVVAEEVRNLAMRSAEAAKNTSAMIEESVQNSRNGVAISTEVATTLEAITGAATKVSALIGEIAAASREQAQGISQINNAVSQMDKVTQANAASAEESASAAEELSGQAVQLTSIVRELSVLVHGGSGDHSSGDMPAPRARAKSSAPLTLNRAGATPAKAKAKKQPAHAIPFDDEAPADADFGDFKKAA